MLRCVAAVSERQLQAVPWQAAGLLRAVCLQQQLPFASLHQQQQQPQLQQQPPAQQGCTQQSATSQSSSLSQQVQEPPLRRQRQSQQATRTLWRQQHLALQPFNKQQDMQQQRVYSSMTTAAHYHARHSGVCAGHLLCSLCCLQHPQPLAASDHQSESVLLAVWLLQSTRWRAC